MGSLDGSEHVLVVPADALDRLGRWRGSALQNRRSSSSE
jgi:hypothetical protein